MNEADLKWWRASICGLKPPRHEGNPECGYYRMREVRGGPFVPVRIEPHGDGHHAIVSEDEIANAINIWTFLEPISKWDYDRLMLDRVSNPKMRASRVKMDLTLRPIRPKGK